MRYKPTLLLAAALLLGTAQAQAQDPNRWPLLRDLGRLQLQVVLAASAVETFTRCGIGEAEERRLFERVRDIVQAAGIGISRELQRSEDRTRPVHRLEGLPADPSGPTLLFTISLAQLRQGNLLMGCGAATTMFAVATGAVTITATGQAATVRLPLWLSDELDLMEAQRTAEELFSTATDGANGFVRAWQVANGRTPAATPATPTPPAPPPVTPSPPALPLKPPAR